MRTLRLSLAVTVILALLGGFGTVVLAQDEAEPGPAAQVTGELAISAEGSGFSTLGEHARRWRGRTLEGRTTMGDPRLSGELRARWNTDQFMPNMDDSSGATIAGSLSLTNDAGSWEGTFRGVAYPGGGFSHQGLLVGSGSYEGHSALLYFTFSADAGGVLVEGLVFPGEMPPLREGPVAAVAETIGEPANSGAHTIVIEELDERMVDLTIDSPAVGTQKVRLLLPAAFDPDADADWPVLYLLHGAMDNHTSWTRETDIADLTADLDLLVVMPEGGDLGLYSDWWNAGEGGQPMWETFHLAELRELLERNWQAGDDRVIAGLSMGGFGAMSYAGRHPEMFKAAASFSGSVHPMDPDFYDIDPAVWGSRDEQVDIWAAHDPVSLAPALEGMPLYVSYGNGAVGPLDVADAGYDETEAMLAGHSEAFVDRLGELDIAVTVDAYGPGTHTWPYWERGLHEALPMLLQALEN